MDNPGKGKGQGGQQGGKGLDKEHEITNTETGEKRQITQREWKDQGQQLRSEGWARAEDEVEEEELDEPVEDEEQGEV
jgi:hypothetical protein